MFFFKYFIYPTVLFISINCFSGELQVDLFDQNFFKELKQKITVEQSVKGNVTIDFDLELSNINKRDYKSCNTSEEFALSSENILKKGMEYNVNKYLKDKDKDKDKDKCNILSSSEASAIEENEEVSLISLNDYLLTYYSASKGKDAGNNDMSYFFKDVMVTTNKSQQVKMFVSVVSSGSGLEAGEKKAQKERSTTDRVSDFIEPNFLKRLDEAVQFWVTDELHSIQKAIVYSITNLARDIAKEDRYTYQVATLNVAVVTTHPDGILRLFIANVGNGLCYLVTSSVGDERQSFYTFSDEVKDTDVEEMLRKTWLLTSPHYQPSDNFVAKNIVPFGGRYNKGFIESYYYPDAKKHNVYKASSYRLLTGKAMALVITPNPDVAVIKLKQGDIIVQATASKPTFDRTIQVYEALKDKGENILGCAALLAKGGKSKDYDSVVSLTVIGADFDKEERVLQDEEHNSTLLPDSCCSEEVYIDRPAEEALSEQSSVGI